jgi:ligand-binding SRPBCC domain-containing protein
LAGFTVGWLTEITHVRAPFYFCDEQRSGPYRLWHHEHFFDPQADGTLLMRDVVHYALPFAPFGDMAHPWLVRPRLKAIFAHRRKVVDTLFP